MLKKNEHDFERLELVSGDEEASVEEPKKRRRR
jgi:hypothetical protein